MASGEPRVPRRSGRSGEGLVMKLVLAGDTVAGKGDGTDSGSRIKL